MNTRTHILSLTPTELTAHLTPLGMPKFRATQIFEWIFQKRAASFDQMTNLSIRDRQLLHEHFTLFTSTLVRQQTSPDATQKILLQWPPPDDDTPTPKVAPGGSPGLDPAVTPDPNHSSFIIHHSSLLTETVLIPADDTPSEDPGRGGKTSVAHRRTACLSTQVGCPVRCAFCASGLEGLQTHLTPGQIIEQPLRLLHLLPPERRITNIVFMGMGEPLANFDATVRAIHTLMAPWAFHISGRKITVSTVGLPPQIKRLADLELPVTLAISLHAPNDELRKKIIPWANKITIAQIIDAGRYYFEKTGRELTLEYIMLDGVNTLPDHARQLAAVARQLRANVNLIYYNEVPELPFKRPSGQTMFAFQTILRAAHINTHIRKSRGREIAAACGQLARQDKKEKLTQLQMEPRV